ncbi:MAG: cofactor assembly of complex C subunit B [Cyanobacteria bacterium P01_F01_bin.150]
MQSPVLSSTFFLTLLMMIGLVFFIRASTKERIEMVQFAIAQPSDATLIRLQSYFLQRSYKSIAKSTDQLVGDSPASESDMPILSSTEQARKKDITKQVFEGMVRPSVFLAFLLFLLAGIGFLCLALVLSILLPQLGTYVWFLGVLAPAASLFYWKKSSRLEQVSLKVEPLVPTDSEDSADSSKEIQSQVETKVTVMGHRDELASLKKALIQQSLSLRALEPDLG